MLDGKGAVVTGGSRGIGRAIVERLAADGATVVFNFARSAGQAAQVERAVRDAGGRWRRGRLNAASVRQGRVPRSGNAPQQERPAGKPARAQRRARVVPAPATGTARALSPPGQRPGGAACVR